MSPNAKLYTEYPNTPLKSGDVISVDCGAYKKISWRSYSFEIGEVDPETKKNYYKLPKNPCTWVFVKAGNRVEDVGNAIQKIY
jgi:methionyl aminopeptidase